MPEREYSHERCAIEPGEGQQVQALNSEDADGVLHDREHRPAGIAKSMQSDWTGI